MDSELVYLCLYKKEGTMYLIGLIDDEAKQLKKIRLTIKTNAPKESKFDFKVYSLGTTKL